MPFIWGALALTPVAMATWRSWPAWSLFLTLAVALAGLIALWWDVFWPGPVATIMVSDGEWAIYPADRRIALLGPISTVMLATLWSVLRRDRAPVALVWLAALSATATLCLTVMIERAEPPRRYVDYEAFMSMLMRLDTAGNLCALAFAIALVALAVLPTIKHKP